MKLTVEQEEYVYNTVKTAGVGMESLQNDIVDHLCCVIETQHGRGKSFDQLLNEAINDLAPHGLKQLENRTLFLLNSNRIIIMKKLMYSIGFIGALILTIGITFKLLHYPLANVLSITGLVLLFLVFMPLLALDRYKVAISRTLTEKMKFILGFSSVAIIGISILFKFFHLQGANILLVLGTFLFAFGFLPFLFFTMYKNSMS
ncbi:hypothetical protein G3O08_05950 [Cryomorpha ignava]|uniref:Uncharacterized protein n=1 Tax=Cryomorpha ignava TaxID=101383 RepID=A0A7K3WPT1_9FLAO|nr:hypothetical protein [Cryomorpha ignava]NEN23041.1 hypothetical protein [Cryomorpha ignava]